VARIAIEVFRASGITWWPLTGKENEAGYLKGLAQKK